MAGLFVPGTAVNLATALPAYFKSLPTVSPGDLGGLWLNGKVITLEPGVDNLETALLINGAALTIGGSTVTIGGPGTAVGAGIGVVLGILGMGASFPASNSLTINGVAVTIAGNSISV